MATEEFEIRFSEQGAKEVVQRMREMNAAAGEAAVKTEDLATSLGRVKAKADPAATAYENLAKNLDILNRAQQASLITGGQEERMRTNLISAAEAQIRPFSSLISSIQAETQAWKLNSTERGATLATMRQQQTLQTKGISLNAEEVASLQRTNAALIETREATQAAEAAERQRAAEAVRASAAAAQAVEREVQARERRDGTVGNLIGKVQAETEALQLNSVERNANLRTIQQSEALKKSGITLTEEETAALLAENTAYAEQKAQVAELAALKRSLRQVQQIGGNPIAEARGRLDRANTTVTAAGNAGLINSAEQAALQRQLNAAFEEQVNPLTRSNRLLAERAEYQTGLFQSGRALAQAERDIARANELGFAGSTTQIAALRQTATEIDKVERAYRRLEGIKSLFSSVVGGIGLLIGGEAVLKSLDQVTTTRNQIGITSSGPQNTNAVTKEVYDIALATHGTVEDTAKAYSRINLAVRQYGYGQRQVLDLTKELNEQIRLSGSREGEAGRATLDFIHAISSGNVQYRELRALSTQGQFVALSIAQGLTKLAAEGTKQGEAFRARAEHAGVDVTAIGIGQLKELTSKHAITSGDIFRAEQLQAQATDDAFKKLTPTIAQSLNDLHTSFLKFIDDFNQGAGAARGISSAIEFVAHNLDKIIPVALTVGSVLLGAFVKKSIEDAATLIGVVGKQLTFMKTKVVESAVSTDANTVAVEGNIGALAAQDGGLIANAKAFDAATAAITRNTIARAVNLGGGFSSASTARNLTQAEVQAAGAGLGGRPGALSTSRLRQIGGAANEAAGLGAVAGEGAAAAGGISAATNASRGLFATLGSGASLLGNGLKTIGAFAADAIPIVFGLTAAWLLLKDSINIAGDQTIAFDKNSKSAIQGTVTLGDVAGGIFDILTTKSADSASAQQKDATNTAGVAETAEQRRLDAAQAAFQKTGDSYHQLHNGLLKGIVDITSNFLLGAIKISQAFTSLWQNFKLGALAVFQVVANAFIDLYNKTIVPAVNLAKVVGLGAGASPLARVDLVSAGVRERDAREAQNQNTLRNAANGLPNLVAGAILKAAGTRQSARGAGVSDGQGDNDQTQGGKPKKAKKDPLDNAFEELTKKLLPAIEAIHNFNKETETLAKALDKGLVAKLAEEVNLYDRQHHANIAETATGQISTDQLNTRFKAALQRQLQDAIDPTGVFERNNTERTNQLGTGATALGVTGGSKFDLDIARQVFEEEKKEADQKKILIGDLSEETVRRIRNSVVLEATAALIAKTNDALTAQNQERTLQLSQLGQTTERIQAETEAYSLYKDAILAGIPGAKEAYDQQVQANLNFIAYKENIDKTRAAYDAIISPSVQYRDTVVSLNNLLNAGLISLQKYNQELRDGTSKALAQNLDAFSGFERGILDIKKESENIAADMEATFKDAYNNLEEGFQGLFTGGSLRDSLHKFFLGITNDLSKALFHKLTDPLISSIGTKFGIPGFGQPSDKTLNATRVDLNAVTVYVNGQAGVASGGLGAVPNYLSPVPANDNFSTGNLGIDANLARLGVVNGNPAGTLLNGTGSLTGLLNQDPAAAANAAQGIFGGFTSLFKQAGQVGQGAVGLGSTLFGGSGGGLGGGLGGLLGGGSPAAPVPVTIVGASGALGGGAGGIASLLGGGGGGAAAGGGGGFLSGLSSIAGLFGFANGGSFDVPGHGATDSKVVAFKATPGENVAVTTPGQQKAANDGGQKQAINQKIVNVMDPSAVLDALQTNQGEKVLLNFIQSNPEAVKRALG